MTLLAQAGRSVEDSTYQQDTRHSFLPSPQPWLAVDYAGTSASEPGNLGPWPPQDGSTGLEDVLSIFGGGAHIL